MMAASAVCDISSFHGVLEQQHCQQKLLNFLPEMIYGYIYADQEDRGFSNNWTVFFQQKRFQQHLICWKRWKIVAF